MTNDLKKYLFITEVGSRMWGMEQYASDYDLFHCYQQPAAEYLRKGTFDTSRPAQKFIAGSGNVDYIIRCHVEPNAEIDAQYMEIGHLVHLLKKGNVNAIWAVCSGVVRQDHPVLKLLKEITLENLSKCTYNSVRGMALSQLSDATKRADVRDPAKSLWTCRRTLEWGHTFLTGGGIDFCTFTRPMNNQITKEYCDEAFNRLDRAYESSKLPAKVDPKPFDDFLIRIRLAEILDNHIKFLVKT